MARKKLRNFDGGVCSDEFRNAFVHSGSITILCEVCGRVHFYEGKDADWEPGKHARLLRSMKTDPDQYIAHDTDSIHWAMIFGKQVVIDCPCGYAALVEKRFWMDRFDLMSYFKARAMKEKKAADHMAAEAQATGTAVEN